MQASLNKVLDGYGSFFGLTHPASRILIFICAMLQPHSGFCGVLGGISVILWRKSLQFQSETERIEIINGILLGMLLGSLYAFNVPILALTVLGALLVVLVSAIFSDTVGKLLNLPLLGLPYAAVAFAMLPLAASLQLSHAGPALQWILPGIQAPSTVFLPMGAMYFNGTAVGGLLVMLAFCLSSRYLALLALASSFCSTMFLAAIGVPIDSMIALVARMNALLAACVIGGLFAVPGKRSLLVSLGASVFATGLTLALNQALSFIGLPVLALPFVLVTYICMLGFNAQRGPAWASFWLSVPALPEASLEQIQMGQIRGVDPRCISLKAPFKGEWQVYQGVGGVHTHQGIWQYALDFFKTEDGRSFKNDGAELTDYLCFGDAVLSPAYGTVVDCRHDLKDNPPGEVNTSNSWGNYILIRLDSGSYVILAHLQENSVRVYIGSRVSPGEALASIGNSGRSPQPHLHMHVQETPYLGSRTIPFQLTGIILNQGNDALYAIGTCPAEGDTIYTPGQNAALKKAMRLAVGNRFLFNVEECDAPPCIRKLEVTLDIYGQFWLESDLGARIAFCMNDELLAFYNRKGASDLFLDALVLTLGSTPLVEGNLKWNDMVPGRLLPRTWSDRFCHAILYPFRPCAQSTYKRTWDSLQRIWTQSAQHKLGRWVCQTKSHLCEARGLLNFELVQGGKNIVKADLLSVGVKEDNGIPEWNASLSNV